MAKRRRPWDKGCYFQEQLERAEAVLAVPSVQVDGTVYKSDRFYLHAVEEDVVDPPKDCQCGSRQPPPLFHREKFLRSLDLQAAILGTFTIDLEWMTETLPQLVGPSSSVPTLILHGHKTLMKRLKNAEATEIVLPDSEEQENSEPPTYGLDFRLPCFSPTKDDASSVDGGESLKTQEDHVSSSDWKLSTPQRPPLQTRTPEPKSLESQKMTSTIKETTKATTRQSLGDHCHLTQVMSAWMRTNDCKVTHEQEIDEQLRESKRGVHHPKFMLLFETSGDLVMVVSTANLTPTQTTEGSWIQRFRALQRPSSKPGVSSDFGPVLVDFLQKLSQSSLDGHTKIDAFLSQYLQFGLKDLSQRFHFDKAQVHLVPVIPGDWKGKVKNKQRFLYGRQRVQSILANTPHLLQSKKDRLLIQPTSFGSNWKRGELADVVRSYLGYDKENKNFWNDQALLERMHIVWPSQSFVESSRRQEPKTESISTKHHYQVTTPNSSMPRHSFVFLSSHVFNSCDVPCISRMAEYQTSTPPQRPLSLVPHFKSVARLCQNRDAVQKKCSHPADDYFSWFLLTSACFSLGAQGKRSSPALDDVQSTVAYANFELGVLFTSQWQQQGRGGRKGDRVYCFRPHECSCQQRSICSSKLVHLPVPYSLHPKPYLESEEDTVMQETPSFHEITDESRCVGNMLLTPYGVSQQNKKHKRN